MSGNYWPNIVVRSTRIKSSKVRDKDDLMNFSALFSFLSLLLGCTQADGEADKAEFDLPSSIDAALREASSDGSGFAVIVELNGEIILSKGYGYADRAKHSLFTPASIAQVGSLTKQFNAAAILQLVEAGEVDLAAPIKKYIPELESPAGEITLHQLLTHSSGLAEYCGDDFDSVSRDEFVDICLSAPLVFEPGSDVAYSNVGYGAIAAVIEFVTERDFEAYLEDEILRPNGLKATGHLFPKDLDADFAHGYLEDKDMGNIAEQIEALGFRRGIFLVLLAST
jgi:CubicO group peptidase (beta-lactamase class C family)